MKTTNEIIDCGGIYEVHPATGGGWAVVNSETGDVRCEFPGQAEAVAEATRLNDDDINDIRQDKEGTLVVPAETVTFGDWYNELPATYLWLCGVGCPTGREYLHQPEADAEDYCNFFELELIDAIWDLPGTVNEHGQWSWTGDGKVYDEQGNSILQIKAAS